MISVKDVNVTFKENVVLNNLNVSFEEGKIT